MCVQMQYFCGNWEYHKGTLIGATARLYYLKNLVHIKTNGSMNDLKALITVALLI